MYGSYISSRMLNTFIISYGLNFSQLPKRDNLHIKDKRPAPNLSVIQMFYCIPLLIKSPMWICPSLSLLLGSTL